jgi:hypothetical protein
MLTFVSRTLRRWLSAAPAPRHGLLSQAADFATDLDRLRAAWRRAEQSIAGRDISIAVEREGAFVAGEGARIYSLDAFRTRAA